MISAVHFFLVGVDLGCSQFVACSALPCATTEWYRAEIDRPPQLHKVSMLASEENRKSKNDSKNNTALDNKHKGDGGGMNNTGVRELDKRRRNRHHVVC